jgi:hypothetical protein
VKFGHWNINIDGLQNMVIAQKEAKCMAKYASVAVFLGMLATERPFYDI